MCVYERIVIFLIIRFRLRSNYAFLTKVLEAVLISRAVILLNRARYGLKSFNMHFKKIFKVTEIYYGVNV